MTEWQVVRRNLATSWTGTLVDNDMFPHVPAKKLHRGSPVESANQYLSRPAAITVNPGSRYLIRVWGRYDAGMASANITSVNQLARTASDVSTQYVTVTPSGDPFGPDGAWWAWNVIAGDTWLTLRPNLRTTNLPEFSIPGPFTTYAGAALILEIGGGVDSVDTTYFDGDTAGRRIED